MYLRTPTATPLIGVLLVVFVAVSLEWRFLQVDVPRPLDCGGCQDIEQPKDTSLRVLLRSDLGARLQLFGHVADVAAPEIAPSLRRALSSAEDYGLSDGAAVIYVDADDEVRWGDLVSTFDTLRGVAPDARIALLKRRELTVEEWR